MASPMELQQQIAELKFHLLKLERKLENVSNMSSNTGAISTTAPDDKHSSDRHEASQPVAPIPSLMSEPLIVPIAATRVVMHQIVRPAETDALGICFGGQVSYATLKPRPVLLAWQ